VHPTPRLGGGGRRGSPRAVHRRRGPGPVRPGRQVRGGATGPGVRAVARTGRARGGGRTGQAGRYRTLPLTAPPGAGRRGQAARPGARPPGGVASTNGTGTTGSGGGATVRVLPSGNTRW